MATTTTNYGFDVPTSSDLVKNGATQIALLGQDLDTFLFRPFTRNGVLNSGMNVWQRGTSISLAASTGYTSGFVADRFQTGTGANQACTISRQLTNDSTNLPFIQYALRYQRNSGQTGTGALYLVQSFESINSVPFAGKTVTFSFYARAGANYSQTGNGLVVLLRSGTGTDQNLITAGYTGSVDVVNQTATLTTTWQRFTYTAAVGATATELGFLFGFTPTGTASTNDYYEITGIQLEVGSQNSPYCPATPTYATELAACQRYYYRATAGANYEGYAIGMGSSATNVAALFPLKQTMRTVPSAVDYGGSIENNSPGVGAIAITAITLGDSGLNQITINCTSTAGITATRPFMVRSAGNTTSYIGFSAELQEMTMDKVTFITDEDGNKHAIIDHGNDQFTSMPKAEYDRRQAEQSTPIVTDEAKTK